MKYKIICLTQDQFIEANYYDLSEGYLDLYETEESIIATFTPGFWKAIMPATKQEIMGEDKMNEICKRVDKI